MTEFSIPESSPVITKRQRIIFGFGSAFFLGLPASGFVSNKILDPNINSQKNFESFLVLFLILFFLVGYFIPKIFIRHFKGLQGQSDTKKDFEDVPQFQWKLFIAVALFVSLLLIGIEFFYSA